MTITNHNILDGLKPENPRRNSQGCLRVFVLSILSSVAVILLGLVLFCVTLPGPNSKGKFYYQPTAYTLGFASLTGVIFVILYILRKQYYQALAAILGLLPLFCLTYYYLTNI